MSNLFKRSAHSASALLDAWTTGGLEDWLIRYLEVLLALLGTILTDAYFNYAKMMLQRLRESCWRGS